MGNIVPSQIVSSFRASPGSACTTQSSDASATHAPESLRHTCGLP